MGACVPSDEHSMVPAPAWCVCVCVDIHVLCVCGHPCAAVCGCTFIQGFHEHGCLYERVLGQWRHSSTAASCWPLVALCGSFDWMSPMAICGQLVTGLSDTRLVYLFDCSHIWCVITSAANNMSPCICCHPQLW